MAQLVARVLTAAALIPLLIFAIRWENPIAVWGIVFVATAIGLREFYNMTLAKEPAVERYFGVVLGLAFAAAFYWYGGDVALATLTGASILSFLYYLFGYREM